MTIRACFEADVVICSGLIYLREPLMKDVWVSRTCFIFPVSYINIRGLMSPREWLLLQE
jgi:hypothetical protein